MLHFAYKTIADLAASLGVHRVSFARLARTSGIPGLVRTASDRWRLGDSQAFEEFVEKYKAKIGTRCARLARFNGDRHSALTSAIRFYRNRFPSDQQIPAQCEREIERLRSPGIGESYTTTEVAKLMGVSSQTVRNRRNGIPGAKVVGQRLRFEKCDKLSEFLESRRSIRIVQVPRWPRPKRVVHSDDQAVMPLVLSASKSVDYHLGTCIDASSWSLAEAYTRFLCHDSG
jgi:excisionase family DNA binding protein